MLFKKSIVVSLIALFTSRPWLIFRQKSTPIKNIEHRKKIDGTPFQEGDIIKIIALASVDYSKYFQFTYIFPKLFHF